MRLLTFIFLLCISTVCLAQENYHNEEYGFSIDVPSQWHISFENEWTDEIKATLVKLYNSKTLLMLNPSGIKPADIPCIQIQGKFLENVTPSQVILLIKKTGAKQMPKDANYLAKDILGTKLEQYQQIDQFYNYNTSKNLAMAKVLYKRNNENVYFLSARAKFIGSQSVIDLRGYYDGNSPEQFWKVFNDVVDSFKFDKGAVSKKTSEELSYETGKKFIGLISKLTTWLLIVLIVLWILKKVLVR